MVEVRYSRRHDDIRTQTRLRRLHRGGAEGADVVSIDSESNCNGYFDDSQYPLQLYSVPLPRWPKVKQLELVTINTGGFPVAVQRCVTSPTARQCYSTLLVAAAKQKRIRQDSGKIFADTEEPSQLVWTPNFLNGPGKWLLITASLILEKGHRIRTTVVAHQKVGQPPAGNVIRRPDILIVATKYSTP